MLRQCAIDGSQTSASNTTINTERGWPEGRIKIARMTLTIKLDGNWSSFQLANSAPPLSVTDSAIAPSARMSEASACSDDSAWYTNEGRSSER
jgi:hypothetical protein